MKTKTIVLTPYPFSDLSTTKVRPVIILSAPRRGSSEMVVGYISSVIPLKPDAVDFILESTHPDFLKTGLLKTSVFRMDKLTTINSRFFLGQLGEVSDPLFEALQNRLRIALDLPAEQS